MLSARIGSDGGVRGADDKASLYYFFFAYPNYIFLQEWGGATTPQTCNQNNFY